MRIYQRFRQACVAICIVSVAPQMLEAQNAVIVSVFDDGVGWQASPNPNHSREAELPLSWDQIDLNTEQLAHPLGGASFFGENGPYPDRVQYLHDGSVSGRVSGSATLHLTVPPLAVISIGESRTRHGNFNRQRHLRVHGLDPQRPRHVQIRVTQFDYDRPCHCDRDDCRVAEYSCCKSVELLSGDDIYMRFEIEEFKTRCHGDAGSNLEGDAGTAENLPEAIDAMPGESEND